MSRAKTIAAATAIAASLAGGYEGLKLTPYYDPAGILTVCRGHTGNDIRKGQRYDLAQCDALLDADMKMAVAAVERCVPGLPTNVLAAFSDAAYNIGPAIACDTTRSTAARMLKAGDYLHACAQLKKWTKAHVMGVSVELPGLVKRREEEFAVCTQEGAS